MSATSRLDVTNLQSAADGEQSRSAHGRPRSGFYFGMAVAIAFAVFLGFAPSFYLRPILATHLNVPPIPSALAVVHAFVFTIWIALLLAQTGLARAGRVRPHRLLACTIRERMGFHGHACKFGDVRA